MKQRNIKFLLALLMSMTSIVAFAYDAEVNGIYYNFSGTEATVTSGSPAYSGNVVIPETVTYNGTTFSVTSIGYSAFYGCSSLIGVTIPNSVTSIGDCAFQDCSRLTSINIPNGVTVIRLCTFSGCNGLKSVSLPNGLITIAEQAFYRCSELESITIPNSVTYIGIYAFSGCSGLKSVNIPNGLTTIGEATFSGCRGLKSINIPSSVTKIEHLAFVYCSGLTSVHISDIATWCKIKFSDQTDNPLAYAGHLYLNGNEVKKLVIPNNVTEISQYAFANCSSLTSVTIPNSVKEIGKYAFNSCSGLTSVNISDLAAWCRITFSYFSNPLYYAKHLNLNGNEVICLSIPNGITKIGQFAFENCSSLASITIPNSVTYIGSNAFAGCSGITSLTIPYGVKEINQYAFQDCSNLTSIVIPNSVTSIGSYAFSGCSGTTSVAISTNLTEISQNTFNGCTKLKSVTIPNSVTSIGSSVFSGCSGLTSVTIPNSVTNIGSSAFSGCSGLTNITIPNSVTSIGDYVFSGCSGLTSISIPNSVTSIGSSAFSYCRGLTSVTIPNSVTNIGSSAFSYCSSLSSVTIPNSVTNIGEYVFSNCSGLTSITIPNSVTNIEQKAFYGCSGLTSLLIPNSVTSIGESAFQGCSKMSSLVLSNELKLIKANTFNGCTSLSSITIPEKVEVIYQEAFASCGLTEVKVLATTPPFAYDNTFSNYNIPLYVPEASVSDYQSANPWSKFSSFKTLSGGDVEVKKCVTPVISYDNGRIVFSCATEGVEYSSSITDADIKSYTTSSIQLGATYTIRVIATKNDYQNSDEATATFSWNGISPIMAGETAKYRLSFVVDNKELTVQNVAYGTQITAPSTDGEGNTVTWYTYPATMPAHDLVVYGMVVKPEPAPAPAKYTLTYMLDGQQYKQETIEAGAAVAKETAPSKEGYTFSGWQNEPTTMPAQNTTVTGRFTINSYRLSFIAENRELSSKNVTYGSSITAPTSDSEGNTVSWYTYPATMPAHDLVIYGMVVKQPEPEVLVWLTVKDGQGTTRMKVRQGTEQVLTITPEEGWKVVSVTWNGTDVTAQVKDGNSYTTPAITSDATLIVVYEQDTPSDVASARAGLATVKVVNDGVVITHAEPQSHCVVYTSNGQQVVSTIIEGDNQKIRLQKGQVYILTINGRTLKFAL